MAQQVGGGGKELVLAVRVAVFKVGLRFKLLPRLDPPGAIGQLRLQEVIPRAPGHGIVGCQAGLAEQEEGLPGGGGVARGVRVVLRPAAIVALRLEDGGARRRDRSGAWGSGRGDGCSRRRDFFPRPAR